jgi:membrane protein YqaA with SNARE-associated domain
MMWREYLFVFLGAMLVDIVPLPLPPAFTIMIFLQIKFDLDVWMVIAIGVLGSVLGRYILTLYIPYLSGKLFKKEKNDDVHFLGSKMKEKGLKAQAFVLMYSLMPLPTTPLFIASGMARVRPIFVIAPFFIGKFISDGVAVFLGKFAAENTEALIQGLISLKTIAGFVVGLILVFAIFYIDWRTLFIQKKLTVKFKIWK